MENLFEITIISHGCICKHSSQHNAEILFYTFSVSILNIENYDFSDMYGYCLEIATLWKFANHASIKWCKAFVKILFQETTPILLD